MKSCVVLAWNCFLLAGLRTCQGALDHQQASHEWLIGWRGESYSPSDTWRQMHGTNNAAAAADSVAPPAAAPGTPQVIDLSQQPQRDGSPWVQVLSWQPRLHLHHNFMTTQEADQLLALVTGSQQQQQQGSGGVAELDNELLYRLEQRLANWTALPQTHIEGWQVHQGASSAERMLHTDLSTDRLATEDFQRLRAATVLLFLSDSEPAAGSSSGWSLVFPNARSGSWRGVTQPEEFLEVLHQGQQVQQQLVAAGVAPTNIPDGRRRQTSDMLLLPAHPSSSSSSTDPCTAGSSKSSLRLTGFEKGSALLIWNVLVDGQTPDATAAHLVCQPTHNPASSSSSSSSSGSSDQGSSGDIAKPWIATTWFHNMPAGRDDVLALAATCADNNPSCGLWASQGFCDDAPGIMLGLRGMCRLNCNDCHTCQKPQNHKNPTGTNPATGSSSNSVEDQDTEDGHDVKGGLGVVIAKNTAEYVECLYGNMHSLRAGWSEQARGAGVRRARNAIRRDLRTQAAAVGQQQLIAQK